MFRIWIYDGSASLSVVATIATGDTGLSCTRKHQPLAPPLKKKKEKK